MLKNKTYFIIKIYRDLWCTIYNVNSLHTYGNKNLRLYLD
jgi:hypothetical protein